LLYWETPEILTQGRRSMFLIKQPASGPALLAILITWAFGLPTSNAQTFPLTDATALVPVNVKAAAVE